MKKLATIFSLSTLLIQAAIGNCAAQDLSVPAGAALPRWTLPHLVPGESAGSISCRKLRLSHSGQSLGAFVLDVDGKPMRVGQSVGYIGYVKDGVLRWQDTGSGAGGSFGLRVQSKKLTAKLDFQDQDGAEWQIQQEFSVGPVADAIDVETKIRVNQDRAVAFFRC